MPSITINEKDYTIYNKGLSTDNIVYVPGFSITGPYDKPVLLTSYQALIDTFGSIPPECYAPSGSTNATYKVGTAWEYAAGLLNAGFMVLFRRIVPHMADIDDREEISLDSNKFGEYLKRSTVDISYCSGVGVSTVGEGDEKTTVYDYSEIVKDFTLSIYEKYGGTFGNSLKLSIVLNAAKNKVFYRLFGSNNTTLEYIQIASKADLKSSGFSFVDALVRAINLNSAYIEAYTSSENTPNEFNSCLITSDDTIKISDHLKNLSFGSDDTIRTPIVTSGESATALDISYTRGTDYTINTAIERDNKSSEIEITKVSKEDNIYYTVSGIEGELSKEEASKYCYATTAQVLKLYVEELSDKILYDVKFITKGNIAHINDKDMGIDNAFMNLCAARGDCIYVTEPALNDDKDSIIDGIEGIFSGFNGVPSSYVAAYAPWTVYTLFNGYQRWMAPSFVFLMSLAKSVSTGNPVYLPPAGVNRASLPEVVTTEYPIGSRILDDWQNKEKQVNVNPIMQINNYGYVIFGQRTLYDVSDAVTSYRSALQEVGVRLATIEIKKRIYNISLGLTFEYNNIHTWNEFKSQLEPLLVDMQENGALQRYKVIMDASTTHAEDIDDNIIRGTVKIVPGRAAEDFIISFELYRSSVKFDDEEEMNNY